jgi:hypothetical protein
MLDTIGMATLVGIAPIIILMIVLAIPAKSTQSRAPRWVVAVLLTAWFAWTAFAPPMGALPGIVLPVLAVPLFFRASVTASALLAGANLPLLIAVQASRLAGGFFIALHADGRLADPFATLAGWGDILSAVLAIPAALIAYRARAGWQKWVLGWNIIGFVDFITAVGLGATSQPGSPIQIFMDAPGAAVLRDLPWRFIPGYYVPLFLIVHIAIFIRLWSAPAQLPERALPAAAPTKLA